MGVSCTFRRHLAHCGTVGGDLSATQRDWLVSFSEILYGDSWGVMRS